MIEHYYSEKPKCTEKNFFIEDNIRGIKLKLHSASGVFSAKRIDDGTKLLAETMIVPPGPVLDLGCGIGVIGIVASHFTKGKVVMADINERAVGLARKNATGLNNVEVRQGNMYEPVEGMKFDAILLNPPQTAGKEICFKMIQEAKEHLNKNGLLEIVARQKKGGETLSRKMKEVFGNIRCIAKKGDYRVYVSINE